ncbi:Nif11-like leader peptide family natural product precursor [Lyngbya sp. CCY1209]|jgi:predicted ribosomally synthesized peptide with nif11-like leader|uniref:Nif11-like leader peptide family natural product precursor n=1 Tax=Lyngbya sp. CCY1209 TaxID=2886103 RepID=UPI002D1FFFFF|nr:Nif11-like leader peptide family natural product precursor [Lyngbya sp. CCY1209]MEB3885544.1 Nif11-like leader peptide family natural product precursor [Lyngbya sp. CCY1209]
MQDFIDAIANRPELQEQIIAASDCEELAKIAASAGYYVTVKELQAVLTASFDELVLQLDSPPGLSSRYGRIWLDQLIESICFSS